jgi:hypothetical protein
MLLDKSMNCINIWYAILISRQLSSWLFVWPFKTFSRIV